MPQPVSQSRGMELRRIVLKMPYYSYILTLPITRVFWRSYYSYSDAPYFLYILTLPVTHIFWRSLLRIYFVALGYTYFDAPCFSCILTLSVTHTLWRSLLLIYSDAVCYPYYDAPCSYILTLSVTHIFFLIHCSLILIFVINTAVKSALLGGLLNRS